MRRFWQAKRLRDGRVQCLLCALALIVLLFGDVIFLRASLAPIDYSDVLASTEVPRTVGWLPERAGRTIQHGQGDTGAAAYQLEPAARFMAFCIRHAQSPYWDPYTATGALGPETLVDMKFSPLVVATAICGGGSRAFSFVLVFLFLWSAYCLLRALTAHLGLSLAAAFAAAALFFLNGFALGNLYTQIGQPYFLAPVLLLALLIVTERPTPGSFALVLGAHVLFLATTFFPTLVLVAIVVYGFTLSLRISRNPAGWRFVLALHVALPLAALALLSFMYVPVFAAYLSYLDTVSQYAARVTPGISLVNLLSLFTPKHIWESYRATRLPPPAPSDVYDPWLQHVGIVAPLVAIHAFPRMSRRTAWPICFLGACFLAAFGQIFGIFPFTLLDSLPFFSFVRNEYWPAMLVLALVLLTAYGFDAIRSSHSFTVPCAVLIAIIVCAFFVMDRHISALRTQRPAQGVADTAHLITLDIDVPATHSGPLRGTVLLGGWAIARNTALTRVSLAVDGVFVGDAAYGAKREDVCSAYPGRPGCPNVGWNFALDTTQFSRGKHSLSVAAEAAGAYTTEIREFCIANPWAPAYVDVFWALLAGTSVLLIAARKSSFTRYAKMAALALLVCEGIFYMNNLRPYRSERDEHLSPALGWLKARIDREPLSRVLNVGVTGLFPNWGSALQIAQLGDLNSGELPWYRTFFYSQIGGGLFLSLDNQKSILLFTDSSLSLAGVRYIVVDKSLGQAMARVSELGYPVVAQDSIRAIFENPHPMPRAFVVHQWVESDKLPPDIGTALATKDRELLVELRALEESEEVPEPVEILSHTNTTVRLRCRMQKPGALVLTDSWHPNWQVKVDGRQVHVGKADITFRAIALNAGKHEILFRYRSWALAAGVTLSFLGMTGLTPVLAWLTFRGQSKGNSVL